MKFSLPVRLQFAGGESLQWRAKLVIAGTRAAHGDAGWSVIKCEDREHALRIMASYPAARMPAWSRIEAA